MQHSRLGRIKLIPTYCYSTEDGTEVHDRIFRMGEAPEQITLDDGRVAKRSFQAENSPRKARGEGWPMEPCVASGVNAAQAPELRKFLEDRGCSTEVTGNGDPIYRSPSHRKQALKLRGLFDRASFS